MTSYPFNAFGPLMMRYEIRVHFDRDCELVRHAGRLCRYGRERGRTRPVQQRSDDKQRDTAVPGLASRVRVPVRTQSAAPLSARRSGCGAAR